MVKSRTRTTEQQTWSEEQMKHAIHSVQTGEMGYKKASEVFGIPRSTLKRRVTTSKAQFSKLQQQQQQQQSIQSSPTTTYQPPTTPPDTSKAFGSKRPVFTFDQELILLIYIRTLERKCKRVTKRDVRYLAFHFAETFQINHPFNKETGLAGGDWLNGFRRRHPELSLK